MKIERTKKFKASCTVYLRSYQQLCLQLFQCIRNGSWHGRRPVWGTHRSHKIPRMEFRIAQSQRKGLPNQLVGQPPKVLGTSLIPVFMGTAPKLLIDVAMEWIWISRNRNTPENKTQKLTSRPHCPTRKFLLSKRIDQIFKRRKRLYMVNWARWQKQLHNTQTERKLKHLQTTKAFPPLSLALCFSLVLLSFWAHLYCAFQSQLYEVQTYFVPTLIFPQWPPVYLVGYKCALLTCFVTLVLWIWGILEPEECYSTNFLKIKKETNTTAPHSCFCVVVL